MKKKEDISLTLTYPNFKIALKSNNPLECLKEIKGIVNGLNKNNELIERISEEMANIENPDVVFNMDFSEEIRSNPEIIEEVDKLMQVEKNYSVCRTSFNCKKILDLDNKQATYELELNDTDKSIKAIFTDVDHNKINYALIVLKGEFKNKDACTIIEKLKKHLPNAKMKYFPVKKSMYGKIAAEILLFGDFPVDEL
tara:strand:- start:21 stop:611 length:591 start_codon:yes stop_codon:yes gene_type:complete